MDNLNQWIDDRQSFERARHRRKKKRSQGLFSGQCCWTVHIAAIVEDPKCSDERQAWGNCLPTKIAGNPTGNLCFPSHYEADQLCVWKPGHRQLDQLQIRFTYVSTEGPAYKEHLSKGAQLFTLALARSPDRLVGSCQVSVLAPQCC